MNKKLGFILPLLLFFIFLYAFAETIVLKSGKTVEGKALEKTDKYIKVDVEGIPITYYLDDIESIDGKTINTNQAPLEKTPISLSADSAEEYLKSGLANAEQGNFAQANSDFTKASKIFPSPINYNLKGLAYAKKGDYDQAIINYTKAIEVVYDEVERYHKIELSYKKKGQKPPPYKGIASGADLVLYYTNRGVAYGRKGDYAKAISDYNKAIEISPKDVNAYGNRAYDYVQSGNFEQAISDYNKIIELEPNNPISYIARAYGYYLMKMYDKAWEDVHKAESLDYKIGQEFIDDLKKASGREE